MPKFKKKPIIVEAEQFLENVRPIPPGVKWNEKRNNFICVTPNGDVVIVDRDWIIKDFKDGFYYPCADSIFSTLFTEVIEELVGPEDMKDQFPTEQKCPKCSNNNYLSTNKKNQKWCPACGFGKKA